MIRNITQDRQRVLNVLLLAVAINYLLSLQELDWDDLVKKKESMGVKTIRHWLRKIQFGVTSWRVE